MAEVEIRDWMRSRIGPNSAFPSPHHLSVASGLSLDAVTDFWETGRGEPDPLGRIAETVVRRKVELFLLAGWLGPEDLIGSITEEGQQVLRVYFSLPVEPRADWLETGERLLALVTKRSASG